MKLTFRSILITIAAVKNQFFFTEHIELAYRVGKVGEYLREESPHRHLLRSSLQLVWDSGLKLTMEPAQAIMSDFPSLFESAMLVGDVVGLAI